MGAPASPDPYSAAFGAAAKLGTAALDDKTNQTSSSTFTSAFDDSGWNLNIKSGGSSQSTSSDKSSGLLSGLGPLLKNPVVLIGLAVLAYMVMQRK
jgi:hypothetical protein